MNQNNILGNSTKALRSRRVSARQKRRRLEKLKYGNSSVWSLLSQSFPNTQVACRFDKQVYRCYQSYAVANVLTTSVINPLFGAQYFTVNSINQIGQLQQIFDQYRIEQVECWLIPKGTTDNKQSTQEGALFYSVIDYDDAAPVTNIGLLQDFANVITSNLGMGHYRCFVPCAATAMYAGAFTGFGNLEAPWIDMNSPAVQHYGIKFGTETTANAIVIDMSVRLLLAFRNIR